jgi:hypothetical protein
MVQRRAAEICAWEKGMPANIDGEVLAAFFSKQDEKESTFDKASAVGIEGIYPADPTPLLAWV